MRCLEIAQEEVEMKRLVALTIAVIMACCGLVDSARSQKAKASSNGNGTLKLSLPIQKDSVRFAIIGDTGSGTDKQQQLADVMVRYRQVYPFEFVLMMG